MPTTRPTKETAQALGVSVSTMRNWSDQYAAYLSETARPGHVPERRFTDKDLTVLAYIKQLRNEGMQAEQIRIRLSETTFNDIEIITQQATTDFSKPDSVVVPQNAPDAPETAQLAIRLLDSMNAMQRQIDGIQHARRDNIMMFGFGFIAAALMFLLLIVLAWLYGG